MLAVYYGEDDYSRTAAIRALREKLGDSEIASLNSSVIAARGANPAVVIAQVSAPPFLGSGRLVVVEGLLTRFEPAAGATGPRSARPARRSPPRRGAPVGKESAADSGLGGWEALVATASVLPEGNTLVLSDGAVTASNPLLKLLVAHAEIRKFQTLNAIETAEWIRSRVADLGGQIHPDATDQLAAAAPGNLWALDAELSKLALYAEGRSITVRDLVEIGALSKPETVFDLIDHVVAGQHGPARVCLEDLTKSGKNVVEIVMAIGVHLRLLIIARDLADRNGSKQQFMKAIGGEEDRVRKIVAQARNFSMDRLIRMHRRLLEHELAFKSGVMEEEISLELLLSQLSSTASIRAGV